MPSTTAGILHRVRARIASSALAAARIGAALGAWLLAVAPLDAEVRPSEFRVTPGLPIPAEDAPEKIEHATDLLASDAPVFQASLLQPQQPLPPRIGIVPPIGQPPGALARQRDMFGSGRTARGALASSS